MLNLGLRFKQFRIEKNLTQKQVAEGMGVAERQYQYYEHSKKTPNIENLIALANFYNFSLDFIVGRSNNPTINK